MNHNVIFFTIAVSIFVMGLTLFFVVGTGAKKTQDLVLNEQENNTLFNPSVTKGIFSIGIPAFNSVRHECKPSFDDFAYINVYLRYREPPSSCEIFVNDKFHSVERALEPECIKECPVGEFARTFHLGALDVRDAHSIRVCCNDICITEVLAPLCTNT